MFAFISLRMMSSGTNGKENDGICCGFARFWLWLNFWFHTSQWIPSNLSVSYETLTALKRPLTNQCPIALSHQPTGRTLLFDSTKECWVVFKTIHSTPASASVKWLYRCWNFFSLRLINRDGIWRGRRKKHQQIRWRLVLLFAKIKLWNGSARVT